MLCITLQKSLVELEALIPSNVIDSAAQPCRLEIVRPDGQLAQVLDDRGIKVYLDVCHNEQGIDAVLSELSHRRSPGKPLVLIFGASVGKKVGNIFRVIERYESIQGVYCVQNTEHPRLLSLE